MGGPGPSKLSHAAAALLGETLSLPAHARPVVDVAVRSNELHPHRPGETWRRAVRFADAEGVRDLIGFGDAPRNVFFANVACLAREGRACR